MSGEHPCRSYSTMTGSPWWFCRFSSLSLEASADKDDEDNVDGDDEDASFSSDDEMTTSW